MYFLYEAMSIVTRCTTTYRVIYVMRLIFMILLKLIISGSRPIVGSLVIAKERWPLHTYYKQRVSGIERVERVSIKIKDDIVTVSERSIPQKVQTMTPTQQFRYVQCKEIVKQQKSLLVKQNREMVRLRTTWNSWWCLYLQW